MKGLFERNKTQLYYTFLLLLVIIVQLAVILHYTFERQNLFVDEVWTFNTSNHYYFPFLFQSTEPYLNQWLPASFWVNSVVVDPTHTFSYDSVIYNMSLDNQPPFYFMIIHTVCSLFPGEFSRWFGIVPNLLFFVLSQLLFYAVGLKLFGKNAAALVLCLLYGSCWGVINNVMLIIPFVHGILPQSASYKAHGFVKTTNLACTLLCKIQAKIPILSTFAELLTKRYLINTLC